jgi:ParB-like chromosome segregation protein Spo0J
MQLTIKKKQVATSSQPLEKGDLQSVSIDSVKLWKENPRKNEKAAIRLADILKVHGQKSPIVVWKKNGVIYKGNTTYKAMKLNGAKTIQVLYQDFPSEQAAIAYGIADNKSSEWAEWDDEVLGKLLAVSGELATGFVDNKINIKVPKGDDNLEDIVKGRTCPMCHYKF